MTLVAEASNWRERSNPIASEPLLTIVQPPQRTTDVVRSLLASQTQSPYGILPVWQFQGLETWCMIGYHAAPEIADAYMKGIRGFDAKQALDAMVSIATYAPYGHLRLHEIRLCAGGPRWRGSLQNGRVCI